MSSANSSEKRSSVRPHSSYDTNLYTVVHSGQGVAIQCQFCPGQSFRRSRLRADDIQHLLKMRYPVRCLRCGQRQMVSFTVAGISVPSHVKQRRAKHTLAQTKHWSEPMKAAGAEAAKSDQAAVEVSSGRSGDSA